MACGTHLSSLLSVRFWSCFVFKIRSYAFALFCFVCLGWLLAWFSGEGSLQQGFFVLELIFVDQAGLELRAHILLPLPPKCRDQSHVPPCPDDSVL